MPQVLTLNDIRAKALAFSREWGDETSESSGKQSFWDELFEVFGIRRRRVAAYEVPVQLKDGKHGKIDVFWPGLLLVEHKSTGLDLTAAFKQAVDYFNGIEDEDLPKYVIVSDFQRFKVYNLDDGKEVEFSLSKLHENISLFGFLTGHTYRQYEEAPEVNVKAAQLMAALHEALRNNGYTGHPLAVLLVRLMFCLFADQTGIWQRNLFRDIIERKTRTNGSDVGARLMEIFSVLDQPREHRQKNLDPDLAELEYVNGHLFAERFDPPAFDEQARKILLRCLAFNWSAVSPAIFGAMFQKVMDEEAGKRRGIGAHYTSEKNILKALRPLLIDDLRAEFDKATSERSLEVLLKRISRIAVLDPACGCGNFLIIAYRELRQLEIEIHRRLQKTRNRSHERVLNVTFMQGLNVDSMYGIEIEEFPCRVAETALYLIDHLMNMKASEEFGDTFRRLPLRKSPHIKHGNALRTDWAKVVRPDGLTCIVGNPPFIGKAQRTDEQSEDMDYAFGEKWEGHGEIDYVAAWYAKALNYIKGTEIPVAFVSTNSITQGEQVSILWPRMMQAGVKIRFAHRTFRWDNDAPGQAKVHCVIIGWGLAQPAKCLLFDYETPKSEPMVRQVKRINPYLIEFRDVFVYPRRKPTSPGIPNIVFGSMPNDGGNLLMNSDERASLVSQEPGADRWIKRIYGTDEFLYDIKRWCLWLKDITPAQLRAMPAVMKRVEAVKRHRLKSKRPATKALADTPWLFGEIRQRGDYLLIPSASSEERRYVPMGFMLQTMIASNLALMVPDANLYHFGVLQSTMHMAWMRQVCGRLESRFRYSNEIVYNNFPWPDAATPAQMKTVRTAAQAVLDARLARDGQTLADLYDTDVMPTDLLKAHRDLDKAVDACYGRSFDTELARVQYLFGRYLALKEAGQMALALDQPKAVKRTKKKKAMPA